MQHRRITTVLALAALALSAPALASGEAQKRWERMNQIRQEKFDLVLPEVSQTEPLGRELRRQRVGPFIRDHTMHVLGDSILIQPVPVRIAEQSIVRQTAPQKIRQSRGELMRGQRHVSVRSMLVSVGRRFDAKQESW